VSVGDVLDMGLVVSVGGIGRCVLAGASASVQAFQSRTGAARAH
jgi:hypothetical protein